MKSVCDFCYSPEPVWEYQIPAGRLQAHTGESIIVDDGRWFACEDCAKLIEAGNTVGLVTRAMENNPSSKHLETLSPKWMQAAANVSFVASVIQIYRKQRAPATEVK